MPKIDVCDATDKPPIVEDPLVMCFCTMAKLQVAEDAAFLGAGPPGEPPGCRGLRCPHSGEESQPGAVVDRPDFNAVSTGQTADHAVEGAEQAGTKRVTKAARTKAPATRCPRNSGACLVAALLARRKGPSFRYPVAYALPMNAVSPPDSSPSIRSVHHQASTDFHRALSRRG